MAITAKSLADGQVAAAKATIYTCPALTKAYVKWLSIHNTNTTAEVVIVYVKRSGSTSRVIYRATLETNETAYAVDKDASLVLSTGDVIEATTTTALKVDYVISGAEEA
jgi:flavorubredoxin